MFCFQLPSAAQPQCLSAAHLVPVGISAWNLLHSSLFKLTALKNSVKMQISPWRGSALNHYFPLKLGEFMLWLVFDSLKRPTQMQNRRFGRTGGGWHETLFWDSMRATQHQQHARPCAGKFTRALSSQVGIIIPIAQMRKLRLEEDQWLLWGIN